MTGHASSNSAATPDLVGLYHIICGAITKHPGWEEDARLIYREVGEWIKANAIPNRAAKDRCPNCLGVGSVGVGENTSCGVCGGSGQIDRAPRPGHATRNRVEQARAELREFNQRNRETGYRAVMLQSGSWTAEVSDDLCGSHIKRMDAIPKSADDPHSEAFSGTESREWVGPATRNRVTAIVTAELRGPRWAVVIAEWFNVRAESVKRDIDA